MKAFSLTSLMIFNVLLSIGQQRTSIELTVTGRYDKHADYDARYGNRSYTNHLKLLGKNYGVHLNYLHRVSGKLSLSAGLGYYRLNVDKIKGTTPWSDNVPSRTIDYNHPQGIQPVFHTDRYYYNNLALLLGCRYTRELDRLTLIAGGDVTYLYTFAQSYHITYNDMMYRTRNGRSLGFGVNGYLGLQKSVGRKMYLLPALVIPVFQQLRQDRIFREGENAKMNKWFNGIGLGISVGRWL